MDCKKLISIIVPVYNVAKYLPRCIDSIISQTYSNLEIILVDDGSTDESGAICDEYSKTDKRIRVLHKENGGQSSARNAGLDIANGEFIAFADADDWVANNYIEEMHLNLIEFDAEISAVSYFKVSASHSPTSSKESRNTKLLNPIEATAATLYQNKLDTSPWCKLFHRHLFHNLRFVDGILYEDLELIPRIYLSSKNIVWSNSKLYFYYTRENSSINTFSLRRLDVLDVVDRIENYMAEQYPTLLRAAQDRKLSASFNMLMLLSKNGYADSDYTHRCWQNIKSLRRRSLCDKNVRLKNKIGILASYFGKILTQKLLTLFG